MKFIKYAILVAIAAPARPYKGIKIKSKVIVVTKEATAPYDWI